MQVGTVSLTAGKDKGRFVKEKFAAVTRRYDLLNTLLSCYIDHYWRWVTTRELSDYKEGPILDLCAGTLPLSCEIARQIPRTVVAVDFCFEMLQYGKEQRLRSGYKDLVFPVCGDGQRLPLPDCTFQGITIAFGIRNLTSPETGLKEMLRVLRPGGKLVILEFSRPRNPVFGPIYHFYLHRFIPFLAGTISGDREAYTYLAKSIQAFYEPEDLAALMRSQGFEQVTYRPLTMGIVTVYTGTRNQGSLPRATELQGPG